VTVDEVAYQLQISHGSAYESINNRHAFHKVCARWVPEQLTGLHKRNVWTSAKVLLIAVVLKVTISWKEWLRDIKHGSTTMSQRVNTGVWIGNVVINPSRKSSKRIQPQERLCLQFLEHYQEMG
jgi:hypothetical protein